MSFVGAVVAGALLVAALLVAGALAYLLVQRRWLERETEGIGYYGRPLAARRAFREEVRRRARIVVPLVQAVSAVRPLPFTTFSYRGVSGPGVTCSVETFARTATYAPQPGDVFVATQMKCGTTWMQQVVYEVFSRGRGDLSDAGHGHLYATSPWIESRHSVSLEAAPRIGPERARIIKTHMPTRLCPYAESARYVYVTRDPVACFASCVDFLRMLAGPQAPSPAGFLDWYTSDAMWWRSWPEHVQGWWRWSQERANVLFVHYEEMLDDLAAVVDRVAGFLRVDLKPAERAAVVEKSRFEYMQANEHLFEMSPPNFFSVGDGSFFVSGRRERTRDVGPSERARILAFCRERLRGAGYPAARFYPELGEG